MTTPSELFELTIANLMDVEIAIGKVEIFIEENKQDASQYLPVLRALWAFKNNKIIDFCGHLRQCMVYFKCSYKITEELYNRIFEYKNLFGFIFYTNEGYSVNININILPKNKNLNSIYTFEKRRFYKPSIGDGRLFRYYEYENYTSISQKYLLYFLSNMRKDETVLACLPTGGGKSLSWQLPAIANSSHGLIIVVVPTVALAIDHERSSRKIYERNLSYSSFPLAYYGGIEMDKKNEIFYEIEQGTLPILYISPEALQNNQFKERLYKATSEGKVSTLVIDEAHLIVNWGVKFRPEFQLLSTFRNKLKELSPIGIKTVLLSATYTEEDTEIIKKLFSEDIFTEFRADELRPEPSYYLHQCNSESERLELVNELVCQAPKPVIVYSIAPDECKKILNSLITLGYENIEMFTGETVNEERERIISEWNENKIDIIVATSAFGMGVDKSDVRTVINAYIPETISRYYQEVGRAGRDGYSTLNYLLTYNEIDKEYVRGLTKGTLLTVESLANRWKEMLSEATRVGPDVVWIDINIPPEHLKFERVGKRNAAWNKDVILLLYRAGLIEILDVNNVNPEDYKILVKLKNINILENTDDFVKNISNHRNMEKERITEGINVVVELIKSRNKNCFSTIFIKEFPFATEICNGCPYCRKSEFENYIREGEINIISTKDYLFENSFNFYDDKFSILLNTSNSLMLSYDEHLMEENLVSYIEFLVKNNTNIIIVNEIENKKLLLEKLSFYETFNYLILTLDEAKKIDIKWLNGICGGIYSTNESYNHELFEFSNLYLLSNANNKIIHVANRNQFIKSEMRLLSELVDQNLDSNYYLSGGINI